eukprot:102212-Hanusia_phi.AAC.1
MDPGMKFDCETCLRNKFGEDFEEEREYVMGDDGPEVFVDLQSPETCINKCVSDHGSGDTCG